MAAPSSDIGHGLDMSFLPEGGVVTAKTLSTAVRRIYEQPPPIPVRPMGVGHQRKIALIGSAETIDFTPWFDPSWEIWCHATCHSLARRVDRYFDQHPWKWIQEKNNPAYLEWLRTNRTPIYMADKFKKVPASIAYPLERIRAEYPYAYGSHAAYMVALALTEGVTHLGFFGIHYTIGTEYEEQRANAEFWAGFAAGRGVQLVIPKPSPFCREPRELYAYETHAGPEAQDRWKRRITHRIEANLDPVMLTPITVEESAATAREGLPKNVENMRRQAEGLPPLLPNGRPAW